ncbi:manganese efflux pump MntP [Agathobaculum sp.]|uniref:manganese efflux pump MntP n=1 Tax=Agathobaculum sp. TaxID=2048138 RepID=UPI002A7FB964|nr:manganese efflux pump MntP family protein [Agathobaculum sp.]MDY3618752.1 manganese efflux pump MntP family protein [Agathobaculum sp.]
MRIWELLAIAVGLSMDAFAVSVCKGLSVRELRPRHALTAGAWFGGFQALMPAAGYILGSGFRGLIERVDHWIAFVLLVLIGFGMVREARQGDEGEMSASFSAATMLPLAVATSIDALAIGVTFAFLQVDIVPAALMIGVITFVLSAIGIKVGNVFGAKYKAKAELFGGVVLIFMGAKILLEHLGILS